MSDHEHGVPDSRAGLSLKTAAWMAILLASVIVAHVGCSGENDVVRSEPDGMAIITIVSGNNQTGRAGEQLAESIVVRVTDVAQVPKAGIRVAFTVVEGGGEVSYAAVDTDSGGFASTGWTIGIGTNALEVSLLDSTLAASPRSVRASSDCPYHPPTLLNDDLNVASVNASGMDLGRLHDALNMAYSDEFDFLNSLLIVKGGNLVIEEYPGSSRDELQYLASITKSFTSAMIGIAIDEGYIPGTEERLFDFFPEYDYLRTDAKDSILLRHVLAMASGFECNEMDVPYTDQANDVNRAIQTGNYIQFVLSRPMRERPGTRWYYNSGNTMLLAGILRNTTGVHADIYGLSRLFNPLGITAYRWLRQSDGLPYASGGLELRSRDLAKFALMYLHGGVWQGQQIVPSSWIEESTINHVPEGLYGYQWWTGSIYGYDFYIAVGYGGQRIINIPDLDMIIIHTSELFNPIDLETRGLRLNDLVREIIQAGVPDLPAEADAEVRGDQGRGPGLQVP